MVRLLEPYGELAQVIGYLHDVVEDTSVDLATIEREFGSLAASCIAILTVEQGINRKDIKSKTYAKMKNVNGGNELSLIVKAADRLANVEACMENNSRKLEMYRSEQSQFHNAVFRENLCDEIWEKITSAIGD